MGKLPLHEWMPLQRFLNDDLADAADTASLSLVSNYFRTYKPDIKARHLQQLLDKPEDIQAYIEHIKREYNASPMLGHLIRQTLNNKSPLWQAVKKAEAELQSSTDFTVSDIEPKDLRDIVLARRYVQLIRRLSKDVDNGVVSRGDSETLSRTQEELLTLAREISNPLLQETMSKSAKSLSWE